MAAMIDHTAASLEASYEFYFGKRKEKTMPQQHTLTLTNGQIATIYKQAPGADIEPGWWVVVKPNWWDAGERDTWLGPHRTVIEAKKAARRIP
jgi:hypothetical protein